MIEQEREIEVEEKERKYKGVIQAPLSFKYDPVNDQWIARWPDGRIIVLHRNDAKNNPPDPQETYLCTIKFKETPDGKGFGIAWLGPPITHPRIIYNPFGVSPFVVQVSAKEQILERNFEDAVLHLARRGFKRCQLLFPGFTERVKGQKESRRGW